MQKEKEEDKKTGRENQTLQKGKSGMELNKEQQNVATI